MQGRGSPCSASPCPAEQWGPRPSGAGGALRGGGARPWRRLLRPLWRGDPLPLPAFPPLRCAAAVPLGAAGARGAEPDPVRAPGAAASVRPSIHPRLPLRGVRGGRDLCRVTRRLRDLPLRGGGGAGRAAGPGDRRGSPASVRWAPSSCRGIDAFLLYLNDHQPPVAEVSGNLFLCSCELG